ncbi:hypothetical protein ETH_00006570 [Eimeria tenella]|uniref:Uncharacterized protein n=1 Tax=Eimeria tenella TaxID=5802 RepID=U6L0F5_EIMTE|nr:hypothetical protein ETH_00006570 [Eimeria tenella]CDJ42668.1 hypothetical protein ETH_00006570 [Eimeria tenella]|eukprot:XP_013233418.1 hypothetical protein ETH_00006570 [Eimeria tenella]
MKVKSVFLLLSKSANSGKGVPGMVGECHNEPQCMSDIPSNFRSETPFSGAAELLNSAATLLEGVWFAPCYSPEAVHTLEEGPATAVAAASLAIQALSGANFRFASNSEIPDCNKTSLAASQMSNCSKPPSQGSTTDKGNKSIEVAAGVGRRAPSSGLCYLLNEHSCSKAPYKTPQRQSEPQVLQLKQQRLLSRCQPMQKHLQHVPQHQAEANPQQEVHLRQNLAMQQQQSQKQAMRTVLRRTSSRNSRHSR